MKTIIIPTDFSANAMNAAHYALELNKQIRAEIVLFHSCIIPVYATDVPVVVPDIDMLKKESLKLLNKVRSEVETDFSNQEIHTHVSAGYPGEEIISYAEKKKAGMVVMGTKGASGLKEVLFGTNTAGIIGRLNCPLLIVPEGAGFKDMKKIVFATNYAENDIENIHEVIELAKKFNAEVILLHISSADQSKPFEYNSIESFCEQTKKSSGYDLIRFKLLDDADVEKGINFYLDEVKADLIAMTNRHRSFFQRFFNKSISKKMAYHTHIPLMVFHVKE
jgi:nucleotide-binding universal stress UspA family protein